MPWRTSSCVKLLSCSLILTTLAATTMRKCTSYKANNLKPCTVFSIWTCFLSFRDHCLGDRFDAAALEARRSFQSLPSRAKCPRLVQM